MLGLSKISWLALAALLLVSCPFSGGDEAPGEDAARLPPPNPLDVSIRADPTNATTKVLGSDGGTLAITLADGTNVELDVPPGALPLATRIGIAPVDSIDGWEFEPTGIAAVQLSPDGLEFFVPATLTFERSSTEPPSANGQISWKGEGTDLHPVLGSALSNGVTIPIEHFSGYGFVWNLDMGYWGQWEQFRGRTWEAYLEQELAAILASDQQKQFLGIEEEIDLDALVMSRLTHWYDWVYTSLMAAAGTSCAAGRAAAIAQTFLARKIALMGADIHELWQRFSDARRERGHPLPYTFDGLPFDFVDRLVATCDREALEACQLTGDLGLLMVYIRDRNNLLEVAGNRVFDPSAPSADDGSDLIERCGRYHVDFDATFADDRVAWELPGQRGHPLSHERNRWRLQLSVDLRWERVVGAVPWVGRMVGEAVPEWTGLGAQRRSFVAHQNDQGEVTGGWAPWCVWGFGIGPWKPWPVELKGLDFARERVQEELPKPPPAIQILLGIHDAQDEAERSGPTFNFEAPLRTTSFKSATLVFHELAGPTVHHSGCVSGGSGFLSGTYPNADMILGLFVRTQPRETKWRNTEVGLSASPVDLKERGSHPEIARVAWTSGRPPDPNLYPSVVERYDWRGTVVLTHTPLGGG